MKTLKKSSKSDRKQGRNQARKNFKENNISPEPERKEEIRRDRKQYISCTRSVSAFWVSPMGFGLSDLSFNLLIIL